MRFNDYSYDYKKAAQNSLDFETTRWILSRFEEEESEILAHFTQEGLTCTTKNVKNQTSFSPIIITHHTSPTTHNSLAR